MGILNILEASEDHSKMGSFLVKLFLTILWSNALLTKSGPLIVDFTSEKYINTSYLWSSVWYLLPWGCTSAIKNKYIQKREWEPTKKETEDLQETSRQCCSYLGFRKLKEASVHVDEESMKEQGGHKVCMHVDMCVHLWICSYLSCRFTNMYIWVYWRQMHVLIHKYVYIIFLYMHTHAYAKGNNIKAQDIIGLLIF